MQAIDQFVASWNKKPDSHGATQPDLAALESQFGVTLPAAYKYLALTYGDLYTPDILDKVCDLEDEIIEVQKFLPVSQIAEITASCEKAGMAKGYICFASDCLGNMFCFKKEQCKTAPDDAQIWFFDHDFNDMEPLSLTFNEWIAQFNELAE